MTNTISKVMHNGNEFNFESVNWWVTSVNWQTGNVTIQSWSEASWITTNQPSNPVAGSTYFDTTNNVLKIYNWTSWDSIATWWSISDQAYWPSWDWQTTTAPSQNAVYDVMWDINTLLSNI